MVREDNALFVLVAVCSLTRAFGCLCQQDATHHQQSTAERREKSGNCIFRGVNELLFARSSASAMFPSSRPVVVATVVFTYLHMECLQ